MRTIADPVAVRELHLYVDNDSDTYFRSYLPVRDNMDRKRAKGKFDQEKAVKGFEYVTEYAAKRYAKEFGGVWHEMFTAETRRECARELVESYLAECDE